MAGTTINGLNAVTSLTAQDEVPVWDAEASGEPTKKITAQNMTASVKTLGSLVNTTEMNNALAGKQNTLTFDTTPTNGSTNPVTSGGIATAIKQSTANLITELSSSAIASQASAIIPFPSGFDKNARVLYAFLYIGADIARYPGAASVEYIDGNGFHVKNSGGSTGSVIIGVYMPNR